MKTQKRFTIGGFHAPYSLDEIQDTPEVIAAIDRLNIGESWDDGNGSEVVRIADACEMVSVSLTQAEFIAIRMALKIAVITVNKSNIGESPFLKIEATPHPMSETAREFLELDRKLSRLTK